MLIRHVICDSVLDITSHAWDPNFTLLWHVSAENPLPLMMTSVSAVIQRGSNDLTTGVVQTAYVNLNGWLLLILLDDFGGLQTE